MTSELYKRLAACVDEAVFITEPSGRMLHANEVLEQLTGYTVEDFQFRQADNPFLHPDDAERVSRFIADFNADPGPVSGPVENRFFDRWGQAHWFRSVLAKVEWEGRPALLFVTSPGQEPGAPADPVLRDYRTLVESAGDGIIKLDSAGRVLFSNARFRELVGLDPVALGHHLLADLLHPAPTAGGAFGPGRFDTRLVTPQGREHWVNIDVVPLPPGDEFLAIVRDVTEKRRLEQELTRQRNVESLGRLAGGVAHDVNNALTIVMSGVSLARRAIAAGRPPEEHLALIEKACDQAAGVCRLMLTYAGRSSMKRSRVELGQLVQPLTGLMRAGFSHRSSIEFSRGELAWVNIDVDALRPVVTNLITNAADALPGGVGSVRVSTGVDELLPPSGQRFAADTRLPPGRYGVVRVVDDGVGMDDETREHLFEPFFTTKPGGHGLGLSSAFGVLRDHGGAIRVESAPGRGTTVTLLLPLLDPSDQDFSP